MARRASTAPVAERNATVTAARLVAVPPSQPDSRYRVPVATGGPAARRSCLIVQSMLSHGLAPVQGYAAGSPGDKATRRGCQYRLARRELSANAPF
jgi:hypothetical protein